MKGERKMRKKALFAAVFALLTLTSSALSSCSFVTVNFDNIFPYEGTFAETETDSDGNIVTSADPVGGDTEDTDVKEHVYTGLDDAKAALSTVRGYDFGGVSLFINTTATDDIHILTSDFYDSAEIDENDYSAAVYERNRMVEEKLKCSIRYRQTTLTEMIADIEAAVKDEAYYADLLCVGANELATLAKEGCLYNLRSLPFFDTNKKYFNSSASKALSAGYYDYGVISTATINPDNIYAMFVNLDKLEQVTDADVEALAASGQWTWDRAIEIAKASSLSYAGSMGALADVIAASGGVRYVTNSHNKTPVSKYTATAEKAVETARALASQSELLLMGEAKLKESFMAGKTTLHIGKLTCMTSLAKADFDWTVVPMPKLTEDQTSYRTYMASSTLAYAVPITTTDTEGAGVLINALSAASYGYLRDTYVKYHMYNTVRMSTTLDMVELIWDTPYFDFAHTLGSVSDDIANGTYNVVREAAADTELSAEKLFSKRSSAADKALKKYYAPKW